MSGIARADLVARIASRERRAAARRSRSRHALAATADAHPLAVVGRTSSSCDLVGDARPRPVELRHAASGRRTSCCRSSRRACSGRASTGRARRSGRASRLALAQVVEDAARLDPRELAGRGRSRGSRLRYFEQSITTATLQHWPARLVPPPRERIGAPCSRQTATVATTSSTSRGIDDADRHLAVVRAVGRVERAAAGVEPDLALDRRAQLGREARAVDLVGLRRLRRGSACRLACGSWCSSCHLRELHAEPLGVRVA